MKKVKNVDDYIAGFPKETQVLLKDMREIILKTVPHAEEIISYNMPAYKSNSMLAWFAGYKNHVGFYPTASGISNFKKEISKYKNAKGSVQFPLNKKIPSSLISKIVKFKLAENSQKTKNKN